MKKEQLKSFFTPRCRNPRGTSDVPSLFAFAGHTIPRRRRQLRRQTNSPKPEEVVHRENHTKRWEAAPTPRPIHGPDFLPQTTTRNVPKSAFFSETNPIKALRDREDRRPPRPVQQSRHHPLFPPMAKPTFEKPFDKVQTRPPTCRAGEPFSGPLHAGSAGQQRPAEARAGARPYSSPSLSTNVPEDPPPPTGPLPSTK